VFIGIVLTVFAYLLGSISFAVVVSRAMDLPDPRSYGSGNPGSTNVLRTGSKKAAALTLLGDALKGFIAVFLVICIGKTFAVPQWTIPASALFVFLGHLFPVFHGFKGGKGVATAAGVTFALSWKLGAILLTIWLIVALGFKISSLAALIAAAGLMIGAFIFFGNSLLSWVLIMMTLLLIWRHKENISRLFCGQESEIKKTEN
jgi:glycerol-3-phosphate acyltransferase PlsY